MKKLSFCLLLLCASICGFSQLYLKDVLKPNRDKLYRNLVNNTITKNLSLPLTDSTEDYWQDAFGALELIKYSSPWIEGRIKSGMEDIQNRSLYFQRSLLELGYSNFPDKFYTPVKNLLLQTNDPKIFAMCANYILQTNKGTEDINFLAIKTKQQLQQNVDNPILQQLQYQLSHFGKHEGTPALKSILQKDYLPGQVLLISLQRKNRNFPGIVLVRDINGNFVRDSSSNLFSVPQLARSMSNMPGYLSNGNTPEGIFRMDGFEVSRSSFIGPTPNIQLAMPFETKEGRFYNDTTLADTTWNINLYKKLLPPTWREYYPVYQSYYAGKAGRTEIIAHGTTINPAYYLAQPYYPISPTQGCLCTKEIWSEQKGIRLESDQQKLINALLQAGGAHGYAIVININDDQRPVTIEDILPFLN